MVFFTVVCTSGVRPVNLTILRSIRHGDLLALVIDSPPVNALGARVRLALFDALRGAQQDPEIRAVLIQGAGRLFSAGADINEFGAEPAEPTLPALIDAIEASAKPVIAAIQGHALGGGLELALGCHYRIAAPSAKLGLPEVKLGLLPGAGGTQRLPRLVGVEAALTMIVRGQSVSAPEALALGLVDRIADESAFLAVAADVVCHVPNEPRKQSADRIVADPGLFERFQSAIGRDRDLDAPQACIRAVRAATEMPLSEGLALERALFLDLVGGVQSKSLRHLFFAERSAARIEDLPRDTPRRRVHRIGVIGAGTMGAGIAMAFLSAGYPVMLVEANRDALDRGVLQIRRNYEASVTKGRLEARDAEAAVALLTPSLDFGSVADCDLVIEAVYEAMDVKQSIFRRLDATAKPGAILASNTGYLDIDVIARATTRPEDVLGLHFFSPANVMKLVEVVRGARTAPDVLATAMHLATDIAKAPVVARVCYGFIGNRMLIPRQTQAHALLLEGATPEQIDRVHTDFGMPMGPFQMADLAGVDIGWHRDPARVETIRDALCAEGRWGQKTGAGFYDYDAKRRGSSSPVTAAIIERFRDKAGTISRPIADEEIIARTLYTMVNEGAKILEEGVAQRGSDIDVVWSLGYGWPRITGGPMAWADALGAGTIIAGLEAVRDRLPTDFAISDLLRASAVEGRFLSRH
jgi:3-hydroxyacyl-CoA dehydrogenase